MAREYENNPEKRSASHDFFIVQGAKFSPSYLEAFAKENNIRLTARQREVYAKQAGAPHLDREHTIFGEVVAGMDVVDKIASLPVDKGHWPLEDVVIRISIVKE
jgi:peptidyl-prolyl cis-trans isomerase B (cyclophilin B)